MALNILNVLVEQDPKTPITCDTVLDMVNILKVRPKDGAKKLRAIKNRLTGKETVAESGDGPVLDAKNFVTIVQRGLKMAFPPTHAGIEKPEEFRLVARAHVIAWRKSLEGRFLSPATIRRKLSAISALFNHLCEANAVLSNPTLGVKRPSEGSNEGRTPAISDGQARALLEAPAADTVKGKRDQAVLSVFLYHGLRREEVCLLKVKDLQLRGGVSIYGFMARGASCGMSRLTPARWNRSMITWSWPATRKISMALFSDR